MISVMLVHAPFLDVLMDDEQTEGKTSAATYFRFQATKSERFQLAES